MLLLTVPFVWDEHEQPYDYARYSTFGLKSLLERNGFNVLTQKKLLADSSILFQLINAYMFKVFHTRSALVNRLTVPLLIAPVSRSEMHTSELQYLFRISYAVLC